MGMKRTSPFIAFSLAVATVVFLAPVAATQDTAPPATAAVATSVAAPAAAPNAHIEATLTQAAGSKVWLGRYAEFEEYLKAAPIETIGDIPIGVTKPKRAFFIKGGIAGSAALKYLPTGLKSGYWEAYKSEIAAYKLDRILGLDMVPPTVERRVGSDLASLQLWVEGCTHLAKRDQSQCPRPIVWAKQVCRQRAFDNLIANIDRNAGNLLVDDDWNLVLIDHSRAFASSTMPFMKQMTRIDREFYERLKALDEATLMREIKPWVLTTGSVRDILKRRDKIISHFDRLASETNEAAVFPF